MKNMSVWSAVILLMIGTFIHYSRGLVCYYCASVKGGSCDDPLDTDEAEVITCEGKANACASSKLKRFYTGRLCIVKVL